MHQFKVGLIVLCTAILVSCGGRANFTAQVSFGDSLSDVGTYKVGAVAALGGGQFTINSGDGTPTNWTEFTALKLGLSAPCAAVTGLDGLDGFAVMPPIVQVGCTGYAQGGARVTHSVGVGHKLTGGSNVTLGLLTTPVVTQINNHLATTVDHVFSGNEIVFVMAGANDLFFQAALIDPNAHFTSDPPIPPAAGMIYAEDAILAVMLAANELAVAVKTQIIDKGARYVVVINVPDISSTPQVTSIVDQTVRAQTKNLFDVLVSAYNTQLSEKLNIHLSNSPNVLLIDAFTLSKDQVAKPSKYHLTNVASTACNLTQPEFNPLASSLVCNAGNLNAGVTADARYLFADRVHPTPFAHSLFAAHVLQAMAKKGWFGSFYGNTSAR